jgi:hypothetical protein
MNIADELELSGRAANVLRDNAIHTLDAFMALTRPMVMRMPRAGERTWREIEAMQKHLRSAAPPVPAPRPEHPIALPDDVARRIADLARAHGYGVELLTLTWATKDLGQPATARVAYAPATEQPVTVSMTVPDQIVWDDVKAMAENVSRNWRKAET